MRQHSSATCVGLVLSIVITPAMQAAIDANECDLQISRYFSSKSAFHFSFLSVMKYGQPRSGTCNGAEAAL